MTYPPRHCEERSDEAIQSVFARRAGLLRSLAMTLIFYACHSGAMRSIEPGISSFRVRFAPRNDSSNSPLIEPLAHVDVALLLLAPVAAAGDRAIDHKIVAVDEGGFVAGEKPGGVRDGLGQAGARDRLCGPGD